MRVGGYTVQHPLSAEAAAVLKLSLGLARSRGHVQLTPMHVAFTLLHCPTTSSSTSESTALLDSPDATAADTPPSCPYGLLRRACVRAHQAAAAGSPVASPHPLQCRALELCLNVALNRLPNGKVVVFGAPLSSSTSSSASSTSSFTASLVQPDPTLSNALVAALKRAQANQRRGCVELRGVQPEQQPLLTIEVELDQLVFSILDDPSVSRVMLEAGFSSDAVKSYLELEDESAMLLGQCDHSSCSFSSCPAAPVSPNLFPEPSIELNAHDHGGSGQWPAQFLVHSGAGSSCKKDDDVWAILDVMVRKQGARTNPVVVGDSVHAAEASVAELMRRLQSGDVPDELRGTHVLSLHLSYVHLQLMSRADVDARVAELRRTINAVAGAKAAGLVIYVGDMRWAIEDDAALIDSSPVQHMVSELAQILAELRGATRGRAWLLAAASCQTYVRCQQRRLAPSLEDAWALQPVLVPAGAGTGKALGHHAQRDTEEGEMTMLGEMPMSDLASGEGASVPVLCAECAMSYQWEASLVRVEEEGTTLALTYFPGWPQAEETQLSYKDELMELKRKWGRLCRRIHMPRDNNNYQASSASPIPWWCSSLPNPSSATGLCLSFDTPTDHGRSESNNHGVTLKNTPMSLLHPDSLTTAHDDVRHGWREGLNAELTVQGPGAVATVVSAGRLWLDELLSRELKRKVAEGGQISSEPKRPRGHRGFDLNKIPNYEEEEEQDDDGDEGDEEHAPSDLTNDGESDNGEPERLYGSFYSHE